MRSRSIPVFAVALGNGALAGDTEEARGEFGIAGGAPGLNAVLEWDPKRGIVIAAMSNFSPPSAKKVGRQIRAWLPR
jgi:hypothetical protein